MEPTIATGTKVIARAGVPVLGGIVVLYPPVGAFLGVCEGRVRILKRERAACDTPGPREGRVYIVSRVVAGPGDKIYVRNGHVYREALGESRYLREADPYIRACGHGIGCDLPVPIAIPAGHWFVLGDNRGAADDSRWWGPVPTSWIVGVAMSLECPKRSVRPRVWVRRTVEQGCAGVRRTM